MLTRSSLQYLVSKRKFSSTVKEKFHGMMKAAAVLMVLRASWNSPSGRFESMSFFELEDFLAQLLMLNRRRLNLVESKFASSTQPRGETKLPRPTVAIS